MLKPKLGISHFKPDPEAECQLCLVCGLNEDGTVNLVSIDKDGTQATQTNCCLIQATDDHEAHYAPKCEEPEEEKAFGGGGGTSLLERVIIWYDFPGGSIYGYQAVTLEDTTGAPIGDFVQGTAYVSAIGPLFVSPTPIAPASLPKQPFSGPLGAITAGTIPWWWIAGQSPPVTGNTIQTTPPSRAATPPYYY